MLRLVVLLLDLVLLISIADTTPSIHNFALVTLLAIKVKLSTVVHWHPDLHGAPSKFINSLLQSTPGPEEGRCPICFEALCLPHKISCNHIFCHDCALLTFAKRDTCPICLHVPTPMCDVEVAVPTEHLLETWSTDMMCWLVMNLRWTAAWIFCCIWQLRLPTDSEIMLAAMRASMMVDDIVYSTLRTDWGVEQGDVLAKTINTACALVVTLSYSFGALAYLGFLLMLIICRVVAWRAKRASQ